MAQEKDKSDVAQREEEVLKRWQEEHIFEKTLEKPSPKGEYVFYDGPPFATGLPHYGHILAGTIKDAIPRYQTMRGYHVRRRWGWDCHGLPLENEIEKELGLSTKRDIEAYGIEKFNERAREAVLRYADDWRKIVPRLGRFVDMERDYKTLDTSYTESVWWAFSELDKKGLIYEGFKAMHLCPRCGTTLSNFEVNQGYTDIQDFAVTVKLELDDEPGTFLLAWTTTPWTLPGNMAAAVDKDATYIKVRSGNEQFILAKERAEVLADEYELIEEFSGEKLVGRSYKPPFNYFTDAELTGKGNAWKVYHGAFVTMEEGTGVVHVAPAFGEDDLALAQEHDIPVVHHVAPDGTFTEDVRDFARLPVKPKGDHQSTDIEIIKHLAHAGLLAKKEKITHSYPLCWRCDTPLLTYASSSWFVRVTDIKDKLVAENEKIRWVPEEIGAYRFGNWLKGARDWAISRSRFWGAPLPVWRNQESGEQVVINSIDALKKHTKRSGNTYLVMRHGEAHSNKNNIVSSGIDDENPLTERGQEQVRASFPALRGQSFDAIYVSPLQRTRETAELVRGELGLSSEQVVVDDRLREISFGALNGKSREDYWAFYSSPKERLHKAPDGGETVLDVKRRVGEFIYELEREKQGKKILIITHEDVIWMLHAVAGGLDSDECLGLKSLSDDFFKNAEVRAFDFVPLPHNDDYVLDLHRPYIDGVELVGEDGSKLARVADVFDCWFESGSMPYAQHHYPFENQDVFEPKPGFLRRARGYPANFIAEGLDQTRGWFYSLLVLGVALFERAPYQNVIVNGIVLAEDGRKLSKRLKNYPDPTEVVERYGADALRFYLLSSPLVHGEDYAFSEDDVADVMRKLIRRTENVLEFYKLYAKEHPPRQASSKHVLDRWIHARLHALRESVTDEMERYELNRATRPLLLFADDLSTWYLRRSRERLKGSDANEALATMRFVLFEYAKLLAPFTPFFAESLYQALRDERDGESVHLADWPESAPADDQLLADMDALRDAVTLALEARSKAGIKVRQPLASAVISDERLAGKDDLLELLRDEVNVKAVRVDASLEERVKLDTELTQELRDEGVFRDIARHVQDMRKKAGLAPGEQAALAVTTDAAGKELLKRFEDDLRETASLSGVAFDKASQGEPFETGEYSFVFSLNPRP